MSWGALAWASKCHVGRAADKLILLALAERHNQETDTAYPSIAWLCQFSSLDRKTVMAAIGRLEEIGLVSDSGERHGLTKQVKGYHLHQETVPKTEQSQKRNSPEIPPKQSQKRDTDTVLNLPSEAKASSGKTRGCRLPDDWKPSEADIAFAKDRGFSDERISEVADTYRDYWHAQPGQKGVKTDWPATWRNWCRREGRGSSFSSRGGKEYVSETGFIYRGSLKQIEREALKRNDTSTLWQVRIDQREALHA